MFLNVEEELSQHKSTIGGFQRSIVLLTKRVRSLDRPDEANQRRGRAGRTGPGALGRPGQAVHGGFRMFYVNICMF